MMIKPADINSYEARTLIEELSDELQTIAGNNGRASFRDEDISNPRLFVIAMEEDVAVGCGWYEIIWIKSPGIMKAHVS
jgi:hypothetical protein